nr:splicing factor U2AF 35 kDa subunit [Vicugna pacos]
MAEYLASIFGTEKDKVNCSFYFKIGACRHGDRCSRLHNKPTFSQTIALLNIYRNPQNSSQSADGLRCAVSDVEMQEHYDEFFEEVFTEMEEKYGEVEEMNVCDNLGDHLVGNVYVKQVFENVEVYTGSTFHAHTPSQVDQTLVAEGAVKQVTIKIRVYLHNVCPQMDIQASRAAYFHWGFLVFTGWAGFFVGVGALPCEPPTVRHRSRSRSRERRSRSRDRGRGGGGGGGGGGRERDRRRSRDRERSGRF